MLAANAASLPAVVALQGPPVVPPIVTTSLTPQLAALNLPVGLNGAPGVVAQSAPPLCNAGFAAAQGLVQGHAPATLPAIQIAPAPVLLPVPPVPIALNNGPGEGPANHEMNADGAGQNGDDPNDSNDSASEGDRQPRRCDNGKRKKVSKNKGKRRRNSPSSSSSSSSSKV